jgi:hypothetical protein
VGMSPGRRTTKTDRASGVGRHSWLRLRPQALKLSALLLSVLAAVGCMAQPAVSPRRVVQLVAARAPPFRFLRSRHDDRRERQLLLSIVAAVEILAKLVSEPLRVLDSGVRLVALLDEAIETAQPPLDVVDGDRCPTVQSFPPSLLGVGDLCSDLIQVGERPPDFFLFTFFLFATQLYQDALRLVAAPLNDGGPFSRSRMTRARSASR